MVADGIAINHVWLAQEFKRLLTGAQDSKAVELLPG